MEKDLGLVRDVAKNAGTDLPLGDAALLLYSRMIKEKPELGQKDFSSVYQFLLSEKKANV
jgi:3-hydroxyisobutyrate dehydrogenase